VKRRPFTLVLVGAAALAPVFGIAQQKTARIGVLSSSSRGAFGPFSDFFHALDKAGWVEGRNLVIDWRYAEGDLERHAPLAAELVALKPDLIACASG
jgi:putative ABC transport system substrate-binding protein